MRFGVQHGIGDPAWTPAILAPAHVTNFARAAEDSGFEAIAFTDHPAPSAAWIDNGGEGAADAGVGLAFCAAVTTSIRLLTFVMVPSYRNPLLAAHQLATLDVLSAGRLTVGLGTGYLFSEMQALGGEPSVRLETFESSVDLMIRAWAGDDIILDPDHPTRANRVMPPVVQRPHPPLWIHGNSRFGVEWAVRHAETWMGMITGDNETLIRTVRTRPLRDFDALARRIDDVRQASSSVGRNPTEIGIAVVGPWPMLDIRRPRPAEFYLEQVQILTQIGVNWVLTTCCGDDPAAATETVCAFGEEVIGVS